METKQKRESNTYAARRYRKNKKDVEQKMLREFEQNEVRIIQLEQNIERLQSEIDDFSERSPAEKSHWKRTDKGNKCSKINSKKNRPK